MIPFVFQFGARKVELGSVAVIEIRAAQAGQARRTHRARWLGGYRLDRFHNWAVGSRTPYRASLFVNVHAKGRRYPVMTTRSKPRRQLNGGATDWKHLSRDDQWDIGQGRYTINMLDEPTWRITYRDQARRVSLLWQVFQKDWRKLDEAKAALQKMASSIVIIGEPDFAEIADRPRKAAVENERKANAAFQWLEAKGFGKLQPRVPVTKHGITVEFNDDPERRLMLLRLILQSQHAPLPEFVSYGWRSTDEGWQDTMADNDYYPAPGTQKLLRETLAKPGPHYFLIRTIRLDELDEASFRIADFFDFAANYK
jgi:hypothetical protein